MATPPPLALDGEVRAHLRIPTERALLTITEAARKMCMRRTIAAEWLRREGLVVQVGGRQRVIWPDVLARLRELRQADQPRRVAQLRRTPMGG